MLANLNELALRIGDVRARDLITESIKCYEIGSYRAATVLSWSTVCYDLIEKLRELQQSGEARAIAAANSLDQLQNRYQRGDLSALSGLLEFERNLPSIFFRDFEFFGHNEFLDIERLREDRNRCAHPSYDAIGEHYAPTAELCRTHIRNAIELVALQPAKFGRAAADRVLASLRSAHFPDNRQDQIDYLKGTDLFSAGSTLVKDVLDKSFFALFEKGSDLYQEHKVGIFLNVLASEYIDPARGRLAFLLNKYIPKIDDEDVWMVIPILVSGDDLASEIEPPVRIRLQNWLSIESGEVVAMSIHLSTYIPWMVAAAKKRAATLTTQDLANFKSAPDPILKERILQIYCSVENWTEANGVAEKIVLPNLLAFDQNDVIRVIEAAGAGEADLRGSFGFNAFVKRAVDAKIATRRKINASLKKYQMNPI